MLDFLWLGKKFEIGALRRRGATGYEGLMGLI